MMQKPPMQVPGKVPGNQEQYTEYKLRVPRNLVKRYNVMRIKAPRPVNLGEVKEANMVRKTRKQAYVEDDTPVMPAFGAGSVYNYERKEEARRKRRGYVVKKITQDDLPYALRLGGKGGKRFTGRKEPILEHSAYYILTQCPDGVFEAVPVQAWYNFMPDIEYSTLTSDEVEEEFSKRDRTLSYFTKKYKLDNEEDDVESKVRRKDDDHGLVIHDDEIEAEDAAEEEEEESADEKKKKKTGKKEKNIFRGKKKAEKDESDKGDSDEEEELENMESKEVDYMSESSSEDELAEMDDEPDPEKDNMRKAKDDLNIFSDSEDEEAEESELNEAGKELKAILKKESGGGSSDEEEEEDEDIDNEFSKSAIFIQGKDGKKKKGKSGSNSGSKPGSRSSTPVQSEQESDTLSQAAKSLKEVKVGSKRVHDTSSPSPQSKKQKIGLIVKNRSDSPLASSSSNSRTSSPATRSGTPSDGGNGITEEAIRRYLSHKPMTTTDLMRKFKTKKTGLTKEQTVNVIASILKKIQPDQEKIDGKLYISIKTKK